MAYDNHAHLDAKTSRAAHSCSDSTNRSADGNGFTCDHSGGNSPNIVNTSAVSGRYDGYSSSLDEEMRRQLQVKDKVITELAGIVEMLEINYGISIDVQTNAFQTFVNIAHSMQEEARQEGKADSAGGTKGRIATSAGFTRC